MAILKDDDDQLMVLCFHRYALGRSTHIVGDCIRWLTNHWDQLTESSQNYIVRDTLIQISSFCLVTEIDKENWQQFIRWSLEKMTDEQRQYVYRETSWRSYCKGILNDFVKDDFKSD